MPRYPIVWAWLALVLGVAGCVTVPPVDTDIAIAARKSDVWGTLDLLRQQDERISRRPFLPGNRVELLLNGPNTYAAMTASIEAATRRIDMESYTFDSQEGSRFADLLITKRAQGISVQLVYDSWGSLGTPAALFDRLRAGGVQVLEYNPIGPNSRVPIDLNRRDHRKLLVVDAAVAITGGVNVSRVYETRLAPGGARVDQAAPWRDTDVRIEGPVVGQFEHLFMQTWRAQRGPPIPPPPASPGRVRGRAWVQAVDGTPGRNRPAIYRTLMVAITLSLRSVHLTTGFFAPTPDLRHALERAARRGVDVSIVVPAHSDSSLAIEAGRADYEDLLEAGVHILERQGVVLHAKTAVIDGAYSIIGSSNLDWRSVVFNNEADAVVIDRDFGRQMEAMFRKDAAASRAILLSTWKSRPLNERLHEWAARLVEPFL